MPTLMDMLQGNQQPPNTAQQILSARFQDNNNGYQPQNVQPSMSDIGQTVFQNTTGFNANPNYQAISPEQYASRQQLAQLAPQVQLSDLQSKLLQNNIMQQTGLQKANSEIGLQNAQAGYYGNALQRDLAEKAFDYQNNPQNMQAMMMANYMRSLSGQPPINQPDYQINGVAGQNGSVQGVAPVSTSTLMGPAPMTGGNPIPPSSGGIQLDGPNPNIPSQMPSQPATQGSGFNPMGAMLAKSLGLTDMQIGPNGQPMAIPGSMKIENGSVISFDQNGKPQSNIPVNPRAQGLFEQKLQNINDNLEKLHAIGGTVEEGAPFMQNKMTQVASSGMGQYALQGTDAQSLRDNIQADVKQALPLYMQAFGITPGMERAQAAQQMLQDAIGGAVGKSRQHLQSNLVNLSQTAGTGQLARQLTMPTIQDPTDPAFQQLPAGSQFKTPDGRTLVKH